MKNIDELIDNIVTIQFARELIAILEQLKQDCYKTKNSLETSLKKKLPSKVYDNIIALLSNYEAEISKPKTIVEALSKIQNAIESVVGIEITVAFSPSQKFIEKLFAKLQVFKNKPILLNLLIDQSIIGGAIIRYKGKSFDGSLVKHLSKKKQNYEK